MPMLQAGFPNVHLEHICSVMLFTENHWQRPDSTDLAAQRGPEHGLWERDAWEGDRNRRRNDRATPGRVLPTTVAVCLGVEEKGQGANEH